MRKLTAPIFADRLKLILMLDACEAAGLTPIPIMQLHSFAFLANVLSPIWSVQSYEGKILKRDDGPFYPELQKELDRLVGLGLATIHHVKYIENQGKWRLEGAFGLNSELAQSVVENASLFADERRVSQFLRSLAYAVARLHEPLDALIKFDATWSDERTGEGDVIDFAEWETANYSAFAAKLFSESSYIAKLFGNQTSTNWLIQRGEQSQLYVRLLERKLEHAA